MCALTTRPTPKNSGIRESSAFSSPFREGIRYGALDSAAPSGHKTPNPGLKPGLSLAPIQGRDLHAFLKLRCMDGRRPIFNATTPPLYARRYTIIPFRYTLPRKRPSEPPNHLEPSRPIRNSYYLQTGSQPCRNA